MEAYNIRKSLNEFSAARDQLDAIIGALKSDEMMLAEHGDVEKYLFRDGFELLRSLLQGYMDRRGAMEPLRESVKGSTAETALTAGRAARDRWRQSSAR